MRSLPLLVCSLLLSLMVTCDKEIAAENYLRTCTQDSDCVLIRLGDRCDCSCRYGAINRKDEGRYRDDAGSGDCTSGCGGGGMCKPCAQQAARCEQSTCVARTPEPKDAGPKDAAREAARKD